MQWKQKQKRSSRFMGTNLYIVRVRSWFFKCKCFSFSFDSRSSSKTKWIGEWKSSKKTWMPLFGARLVLVHFVKVNAEEIILIRSAQRCDYSSKNRLFSLHQLGISFAVYFPFFLSSNSLLSLALSLTRSFCMYGNRFAHLISTQQVPLKYGESVCWMRGIVVVVASSIH